VRDLLDEKTGWIQEFSDMADWIVSLDLNGHAALLRSCANFFVEIAANDFKKCGSMLVGMEYVACDIHSYTLFEVVYLTKSSGARKQLAHTLVETYAKLLGFLAGARVYHDEHTLKRTFKAIFNEGGVDSIISTVDSKRVHIEQKSGLIDR
jgi:hypothetical protein